MEVKIRSYRSAKILLENYTLSQLFLNYDVWCDYDSKYEFFSSKLFYFTYPLFWNSADWGAFPSMPLCITSNRLSFSNADEFYHPIYIIICSVCSIHYYFSFRKLDFKQ